MGFTRALRKGTRFGRRYPDSAGNPLVEHRYCVPPDVPSGKVVKIFSGEYTVTDVIATLETPTGVVDITMMQEWPVRKAVLIRKIGSPYPVNHRSAYPLIRFSLLPSGHACIPGPFGSGKTVHSTSWPNGRMLRYGLCWLRRARQMR